MTFHYECSSGVRTHSVPVTLMTRVMRSSRPSGRETLDLFPSSSLSFYARPFFHIVIFPQGRPRQGGFFQSESPFPSLLQVRKKLPLPRLRDSASVRFILLYPSRKNGAHCCHSTSRIILKNISIILVISPALLCSKQNERFPNSEWHLSWRKEGRHSSIKSPRYSHMARRIGSDKCRNNLH